MSDTPEKYQTLIDRETWDFIRLTDSWYPPDTVDFSIAKQRETYDAMCREFYKGVPAGVTTTDDTVAAKHPVPVRHYRPAQQTANAPRVVYFHGGGFVVGGLQSHDDVCSEICANTGLEVTAVDYRLSPEHAHPAAFDDSMAVVEALAAQSSLVLCGDSAGGNLAAAVSHAMRGNAEVTDKILGQVLIYPGLGGDMSAGSYVTHANAPMLKTQDVRFYSMIRSGGVQVKDDPSAAPLHDTDFSNLPPTVVVSAECDPLSDDGMHYCEHINASGGQAVWFNETGLVHGYLRGRTTVTRARDSFKRILNAITMLSDQQWNYPQ
jgi:acetyl esterase